MAMQSLILFTVFVFLAAASPFPSLDDGSWTFQMGVEQNMSLTVDQNLRTLIRFDLMIFKNSSHADVDKAHLLTYLQDRLITLQDVTLMSDEHLNSGGKPHLKVNATMFDYRTDTQSNTRLLIVEHIKQYGDSH